MNEKIYTIKEIIDYNICPRKYMLKYKLGLECSDKSFREQVNDKYNAYAYEAIIKSFYYLFMKLKKDEDVNVEQFKKQFGNIYYKNLSALDIIGMETRSPGDLEPLFTSSLDTALKTFNLLNKSKWKPLIVDKDISIAIGDYTVTDKIDAILENRNQTSSIEILKFSQSKIKNIDDIYVKNNFHLNFGRYMLRTMLDSKEDRTSIVYPYKAYRQVISKPDEVYLTRFKDIVIRTCEDIRNEYYPAFVNKFKCDKCAYKAICDSYRERV